MRGGICEGRSKLFGMAFGIWLVSMGFSNVNILAGTMSPVARGRQSNREIPEVYAYVNNYLHKTLTDNNGKSFYERYGIKKFGHWLGNDKKRAHQELTESAGGGVARKLLMGLNKVDVPAQLYFIFTSGGIDFVGGYTYYQFLKTKLSSGTPAEGCNLGTVDLQHTGEQVHDMLFQQQTVKCPAHWKSIVSYF